MRNERRARDETSEPRLRTYRKHATTTKKGDASEPRSKNVNRVRSGGGIQKKAETRQNIKKIESEGTEVILAHRDDDGSGRAWSPRSKLDKEGRAQLFEK